MTKTFTFSGNQIAKGYNNYSGLQNIELIAVGGNVPDPYLLPVDDLGMWNNGEDRVLGNGQIAEDGDATTRWKFEAFSFSQWYYIYAEILDYKRSGPVTIRTRKYHVPMSATMSYHYVIANAILTLPKQPKAQRGSYISGFNPLYFDFSRLNILHEDAMYGELSVKLNSTDQENVGTSAQKLVCFDTSGANEGFTASVAASTLTPLLSGTYEVDFGCDFLPSAASFMWTFAVRINGVESQYKRRAETNATPKVENVSLSGKLVLDAGDIVTVYIESDDGTALVDVTIVNAVFGLNSLMVD